MDLPQEFSEYSHETQQQMMDAVDDFFDMFPLDYFSKDSQSSESTSSESGQAESHSLENTARPLDNLEEPVRHDAAMPTPVSSENHSPEPETEESSKLLFVGNESGDDDSLFGDSDSGENSGASAEDKPEELVRHDSTVPTPVSGGTESPAPGNESYDSLFDGSESSDEYTLFGDGDANEDTGASPRSKPEELVRAPSPGSIQGASDDEDVFEALERELEEADVDTGASSSSGEGDAGEDTRASSQDNSAELSQFDSAVPSPTASDSNSESDDIDSLFGDSSENTSSDPSALSAVGDYRPTSQAPPSRQPQSQEESFGPSRRPLALPPQRPQPAVQQPNSEDPAVRFPGLALPRRKPAAPPVASSTATPSTQHDANPGASVDAQSRKRARDDSPIEIEDSSPEPKAKRARKEKETSCKCKNCQRGIKCTRVKTGPQPCTQEELDARNGAALMQLGIGTHKYGWMGNNRTQDRYGTLPPSQTKEAKARREAVQQLGNSIHTAKTELPFDPAVMASDLGNAVLWSADGILVQLPEDEVDTGISVNSNDTTVDLRGEPSVSAPQASPPVLLFADRFSEGAQVTSSSTIIDLTEESSSTDGNSRSASFSTESSSSGISATSSRTTIDLTKESTPAQGTPASASLAAGRSNSGASATPGRTTTDLSREPEASSPELAQTGQSVSTPDPNRPVATHGRSSVHDVLLRQQEEAMKEHTAAFNAELQSHRARGYLTDVAIDFSGPGGVYEGRRQMKRDMDMNNYRAQKRS